MPFTDTRKTLPNPIIHCDYGRPDYVFSVAGKAGTLAGAVISRARRSAARLLLRARLPPVSCSGLTRKQLLTYPSAVPLATDVYSAIADPTRRRLLDLLVDDGRSVNDLAAPFVMSRPAVSQHLKVLREAGLVRESRAGRRRIYRLAPDGLREVDLWLRGYRRFWEARLAAFGSYLDAQEVGDGQG
jgi:DNA-binding transcriptional ArsR family regulator